MTPEQKKAYDILSKGRDNQYIRTILDMVDALAASQPAPAADTGQGVALKPCPFCGGANTRRFSQKDEFDRPSYGVQCANGDCWISGPECDAADAADEAWNNRSGRIATKALLDMSNMLRHAFISGFEAKGGTVTEAIGHWPDYDPEKCAAYPRVEAMLAAAPAHPAPLDAERVRVARPLGEGHEDHGFCVWWTWHDGRWLGEPSFIGSPLCSDWPGYHTHWTPHPPFPAALRQKEGGE